MIARSGRVAGTLAALLLAACAATPPRPLPPPALPVLTGGQCLADLDARDVAYRLTPVRASTGPCAVDTSVQVTRAAVAWNQPALMSCGLADRLDRFIVEAAEPLALQYFRSPLARLDHFGAYSCRRETGSGSRWSEHASGRAIDIKGFVLTNGEMVSVEQDWDSSGRKGAFLHALARRACDYFNAVLTPESDRYHYNHLHLDLGPYRLCQI